MGIKIIGTGFYVPENTVTNDDLSKIVETSDEWISQRVGVKSRHISTGETSADLAIKAAENALSDSGLAASDIDMIIAATISSDTICPTVAGTVERAIGAHCPAFDINSACSGFVFALDIAQKYIASGFAKRILVLGSERLSKIIDWTDRSTCVIFGDGAGAAVVEEGEMYESVLFTEGGDEVIKIPNFSVENIFCKANDSKPYIFMDGQETFKFAVNKIASDIKEVTAKAGLEISDIDYIVPHQANTRIIEFAAKRLKLPIEKFFVNLKEYGNTSSASVPIALSELKATGKLKRGDVIVLTAFGGGLSGAASIFKW